MMKTMTDDKELIARLRSADLYNAQHYERDPLHKQAADRIEALTAKLAKAGAGLLAIAKRDEQMIWGEDYEVEEAFKDMRDIALATLAAVTETHKIKSSKAAPPYGLEGESHE